MLLSTALLHFDEDIGRATALHAHAEPMAAGILRDDMLRAAWMMAVGACDAYFSDAYADLVSRTLQAKAIHPAMAIPDRMNNLKIPVIAVIGEGRTYGGWRWRMAARELIEDENVLSLKKIKELFNQFFPEGGKLMHTATIEPWILHRDARVRHFGISKTAYRALAAGAKGSAKARALEKFQAGFGDIFQRRHDCIHNCDRPKVALQPISAATVEKRIEDVSFLVRRCHADLVAAFPLYLRRCDVPGAVRARVGAGGGERRRRRPGAPAAAVAAVAVAGAPVAIAAAAAPPVV
jgi:hypothetical protein